ncbi:MAG: hypothetical protein ACOCQD_01585, partial [archaeon]
MATNYQKQQQEFAKTVTSLANTLNDLKEDINEVRDEIKTGLSRAATTTQTVSKVNPQISRLAKETSRSSETLNYATKRIEESTEQIKLSTEKLSDNVEGIGSKIGEFSTSVGRIGRQMSRDLVEGVTVGTQKTFRTIPRQTEEAVGGIKRVARDVGRTAGAPFKAAGRTVKRSPSLAGIRSIADEGYQDMEGDIEKTKRLIGIMMLGGPVGSEILGSAVGGFRRWREHRKERKEEGHRGIFSKLFGGMGKALTFGPRMLGEATGFIGRKAGQAGKSLGRLAPRGKQFSITPEGEVETGLPKRSTPEDDIQTTLHA